MTEKVEVFNYQCIPLLCAISLLGIYLLVIVSFKLSWLRDDKFLVDGLADARNGRYVG